MAYKELKQDVRQEFEFYVTFPNGLQDFAFGSLLTANSQKLCLHDNTEFTISQ